MLTTTPYLDPDAVSFDCHVNVREDVAYTAQFIGCKIFTNVALSTVIMLLEQLRNVTAGSILWIFILI